MFNGPEAITSAMLSKALDAASMRQQIIATNIANANVADYVPLTVNFEAQLGQLTQTRHGLLDAASLAEVRPTPEPMLDTAGFPAKVMLDVEVSNLAQNAVHYQALVKCLSRQNAILSAAVSDGKK